jgi:hypothetical protein
VSLIDEALKRAQAAADRDAPRNRPWVPTPLPDTGLARRRRVARATAVGAAAGLGAAGVAALLIWAARGSSPRVTNEPASANSAAASAPAAPQAAPVAAAAPPETRAGRGSGFGSGSPPARVASAAGAAAAAPTPGRAASASPARDRVLAPSIEETPVHVAPPPHLSASLASASGSPAVRAAAAGKSYKGKVALPDGGSLELGGIVWSEADPRALINDRVVGVGAYVQGYTIERIEEDRVVMEKDGKRITITVR